MFRDWFEVLFLIFIFISVVFCCFFDCELCWNLEVGACNYTAKVAWQISCISGVFVKKHDRTVTFFNSYFLQFTIYLEQVNFISLYVFERECQSFLIKCCYSLQLNKYCTTMFCSGIYNKYTNLFWKLCI